INNKNSLLIEKIIEKSTFTNRQIQIIYNIQNKAGRLEEISSGAYYREVKQCKNKLRKLFYSIVLLNLMEILDNEQLITLTSIVDKLNRLQNNHDKYHDINIDYVINVIDQLFDKILFK
ncbi:MAG: hypothetical protein M3Z01_09750, partial [Thermoproteota archaeon]|nr:hypothetical protein [Thermoproteota archaeon]